MAAVLVVFLANPSVAAPQEVLARTPADLPRAEQGRWAGWRGDQPPEAAVGEPFLEALKAYLDGRNVDSLGRLYALLEEAPDYPPALHQLGTVHYRLRRYGDARVAFERFLEVAPGEVARTRALGHAYYGLGQYEAAREHYRRVLAARRGQVEALRGLALSNMRLGENGRALQLLDEVLALRPDHAEASRWRAQVLFDEERLEEARDEVARARELDPFQPAVWFLTSRIAFELGDEEQGEAARSRHAELDRVEQAARHLEARLALDPGRPTLWLELAGLRHSVGDATAVTGAMEGLLALDPSHLDWRILHLDLLVDLGERPGCDRAAAALAAHCGHLPEAWTRLEQLHLDRGDVARAAEAARRRAELERETGGGRRRP